MDSGILEFRSRPQMVLLGVEILGGWGGGGRVALGKSLVIDTGLAPGSDQPSHLLWVRSRTQPMWRTGDQAQGQPQEPVASWQTPA